MASLKEAFGDEVNFKGTDLRGRKATKPRGPDCKKCNDLGFICLTQCPKCNKETYSMMNDGGSIVMCVNCDDRYKSPKCECVE